MIVTIIGWLFVALAVIIFLIGFAPNNPGSTTNWPKWAFIWTSLLAIGGLLLK